MRGGGGGDGGGTFDGSEGMPSFVRMRAWKEPTGPPPEIRIVVVEDEEDDMLF